MWAVSLVLLMTGALGPAVHRAPESRSKTAVNKVSGHDGPRKAGPLEQTWIEHHRKKTGCKGERFEKKGGCILFEYTCKTCGKKI